MSTPSDPILTKPPTDKPVAQTARVDALSMSGWLLAINVGVYVLGHMLWPSRNPLAPSRIDGALLFSYASAVQNFEVWRFLSFQFVHANLFHLAGNMVALMSLGPVVEAYLGRRRFLAFYLTCGAVGPVAFLILSAIWPATYPPAAGLVGASAGVFGILVGAAVVAPDDYVLLIFPPTPVRLRTAAMLMLVVAAYTVFAHGKSPQFNAGGEAAHLGGAAMGYYLIRRPDSLDWAERVGPRRRWHPR